MNKAHLGARFIAALGITDWGISDPSESFFRNLLDPSGEQDGPGVGARDVPASSGTFRID